VRPLGSVTVCDARSTLTTAPGDFTESLRIRTYQTPGSMPGVHRPPVGRADIPPAPTWPPSVFKSATRAVPVKVDGLPRTTCDKPTSGDLSGQQPTFVPVADHPLEGCAVTSNNRVLHSQPKSIHP